MTLPHLRQNLYPSFNKFNLLRLKPLYRRWKSLNINKLNLFFFIFFINLINIIIKKSILNKIFTSLNYYLNINLSMYYYLIIRNYGKPFKINKLI